jgi:L-ascorbate metabolism protein UlaG (beta-lactamase superfamily)
LIAHEHGDHFNQKTLDAVAMESTVLITNPNVYDALSGAIQVQVIKIVNGEDTMLCDVAVEAIAAYNLSKDRLNFQPEGHYNGYVLTVDGARVYILDDTEDVPEMCAFKNIDIAFFCMNLPFTMDANATPNAVYFMPANV